MDADGEQHIGRGVEGLLDEAAVSQRRTAGVRSGARLVRVQMTMAPGAHSSGSAEIVVWTSTSLMLPKTPAMSTRSAGTAWT